MNLRLTPKKIRGLHPSDIVFQTEYWGEVKTRLGWKPYAFDIGASSPKGDVLVLIKHLGGNISAAFVPQGPEYAPAEENYGVFLEALSEKMADTLDSKPAFIRYDLPWESPYACELQRRKRDDYPESRIREMRMNFGTKYWNLKKAPVDMTATHSLIVDITGSEEDILSRMKPKTRYNIRLAGRKGVRVEPAPTEALPLFYKLYCETALRNGFPAGEYESFTALFEAWARGRSGSEVVLLLARHDKDLLAGAIIALSNKGAIFLHGASSNAKRNFMAPYALHWEAIRFARSRLCRTYDMGAVSPAGNPQHPFFGLYRFKTGFGGEILHRSGAWDYPLKNEVYTTFRNLEMLPEDKRQASFTTV